MVCMRKSERVLVLFCFFVEENLWRYIYLITWLCWYLKVNIRDGTFSSWLHFGWVDRFFPYTASLCFSKSQMSPQCCPSIFFSSSDNTVIVTKNLPYRGMSWERGKLEFPATENLETRICQRLPFCFLQNKTWTSGLLSSDHLPFLYFLQCSPAKCVLLRLRRGVLTLEDVFRSCTCKFLFFVWIDRKSVV